MIYVVKPLDGLPTVSALTALCAEQLRDICGRVAAWRAPSLGADTRLSGSIKNQIGTSVGFAFSEPFNPMFDLRSFLYLSGMLVIRFAARFYVNRKAMPVLSSKSVLDFCRFGRVRQSVGSGLTDFGISVGGVVRSACCKPLVSVFGVMLGMVPYASRFLTGKKSRRGLSLLRLAASKLRRGVVCCYNVVSHVERSIVRMVRNAVTPGPGCGISFLNTPGPCQQEGLS